MIVKNISILYGKELKFIPSASLLINQRFEKIQPKIIKQNEKSIDAQGLLLIPGLINAHTHVGDSIAKDIALDSTVDQKIHPKMGAKSRILKNTISENLVDFMKSTCQSMIQKGTTTFVDFREGGLEGIDLLKKSLSSTGLRSIILGRIEYYQKFQEIKKNHALPSQKAQDLKIMLANCDGIGISGANENSDAVLMHYSKTQKLRAIHCSETMQSVSKSKKNTAKSEVIRALNAKPHFLVHMTHAAKNDLVLAAKKTRGIVICPRANATLAEGIPDIQLMQKAGCTIALGTDNVMINSPDMFREMDYLWNVTMGIHKKRIEPREILKMATVNAGEILHKDIGVIQSGKIADGVFLDKHALDLEPMHNPYASIVHRASESAIRAVMVGGKIIHGKI